MTQMLVRPRRTTKLSEEQRRALLQRREDVASALHAVVAKKTMPMVRKGLVALGDVRISAGSSIPDEGWHWLLCLDGTGEETPYSLLTRHVERLRLIPKTAFELDELEEAFRTEEDPLKLVARFCPEEWANHCRARDEV